MPYSLVTPEADALTAVANGLSEGRGPSPWTITMPEEFGKAWLHLLSLYVYWSVSLKSTSSGTLMETESRRFQELVGKGRKALMREMVKTPLHEREATLPLGIMSLITKKLLEDVMMGQPDVRSLYYDYLKILVGQTLPFI